MSSELKGAIAIVTGGCAIHGWPGWGPHYTAKAGLNQFSYCLCTELREAGIRVTTITPYWGATDFVAAAAIEGHPASDPEVRRKIMQPREMEMLVLTVCTTPSHLVLPDITVQPLVQQIEPM